jgi:V8-like Glu-specific endopeptidase
VKYLPSLLLASTALGSISSVHAQQQMPGPTIYNNQPSAAASNSAGSYYWTLERMRAAKPKDNVMLKTGSPRASTSSPTPTGSPGLASVEDIESTPFLQDQLKNNSSNPSPNDGPYPGPNTTYQVLRSDQPIWYPPFGFVGTLFFTEPGVGDFRCTASTTIGNAVSPNRIWTAGHCVANGGHSQFYTNWQFCPAWRQNSPQPFWGCWGWRSATTTAQWFSNGAFSKDYASIQLNTFSNVVNQPVTTAVGGGFGFAWNWARDQHWSHMGYPAGSPYDGNEMIRTDTEHRYDDTPDVFGPPTNSWGSPQTGGSSGSPVVLFWNYGGGFLNSNVSYGYNGQPDELYGPYYDTAACNFWKAVTNWPGTC